ncbi:MAG TPA: 16S rRNA (uracil(1498)-N(3))-methyltransferase [Burkholderiales bacterium]|jgi:16S rRNA (uracil1498-N3)-methyltransferase|nr:16S rRNA (uracil(1498)-N(3))-methyltransferase [Burkholderiales bacterium]
MAKDLEKKSSARPGARFHVDGRLGNGSDVRLPPDAAHHAARVLRLEAGDPIVLFDGHGGEFEARITRLERGEVHAKTGAHREVERESGLEVHLVQGLSSGERMDFTLQKAVELGVAGIQPVAMERSVVRLKDERAQRRVEHWQNLVIAACEQCGRNRVPRVAPVLDFGEYAGQLGPAEGESRLLLSPQAAASLRSRDRPAGRIVLMAGPEGGLAPGETQTALARGFEAVRLGPRVLRTETAAVAALAALQALWGDF